MTQALNLYDARWLARRRAMLPWQPMAMLCGAALSAALVAGWNHWQREQLGSRLQQAQADSRKLAAAADPAGDRSTALAALADAAQRREQTVAQWRGLDAASTNGPAAGGAAASQWMQALGTVVVDNLWLTRIQIDVTGALRLEGRARDGVALSDYLERWRKEPLLGSIALQTLEMRRPSDIAGKPPTADSGPAGVVDTTLAFTLSNLAAGRSPGAGDAPTLAGAAAKAPALGTTPPPADRSLP